MSCENHLPKKPSYRNFSSNENSSDDTYKILIDQLDICNKLSPLSTEENKPGARKCAINLLNQFSKENQSRALKCFKCEGFGDLDSNYLTQITITIVEGEAYEVSE